MKLFNIFLFINFFNILFFLIDKMICTPIILSVRKNMIYNEKDYRRTRWYILHIFINILCSITSFNGIYYTFKNIHTSLNPVKFAKPYTKEWLIGPTSPLPTLIIASGHLYHMLFYKISNSDIYHHLFFAFTMTSINMMGDYGFARNVIPFILCGLPGIIEYIIMSMYKLEFIIKKRMRYYITLMHCVLRLPLGIITAYSLLYQILFNPKVLNPNLTLIVGILVLINVIQYCYENIKSSIRHYSIK
jgi:hypothetical protein